MHKYQFGLQLLMYINQEKNKTHSSQCWWSKITYSRECPCIFLLLRDSFKTIFTATHTAFKTYPEIKLSLSKKKKIQLKIHYFC